MLLLECGEQTNFYEFVDDIGEFLLMRIQEIWTTGDGSWVGDKCGISEKIH